MLAATAPDIALRQASVKQRLSRTPPSRAISYSSFLTAERHQIRKPQVLAAAASSHREDALLLSFYACQNKSLFAAQCFVETVLDAYTWGDTVDELQTALQLKNMQQNSQLLNPIDQDLLLSWIILVMLTAKDVGVPAGGQQQQQQQQQSVQDSDGSSTSSSNGDAAAGISVQYSTQVLGLLQFAKQALKLYFEQGYSVTQLQGLQAAVASDPGQGRSQFMELMQQYTLLVIITLEVIAECKIPTQKELQNPISLHAPSGYTAAFCVSDATPSAAAIAPAGTEPPVAFSNADVGGQQPQQPQQQNAAKTDAGLVTAAALAEGRGGVRAQAVLLMTAFVGGVLGVPFALRSFLVHALEAYSQGVSVPELCAQLQATEFLQAGGLVPVTAPSPEVAASITQQLFGRWLSIVYTTAAQLNAVFPAAAEKTAWAWYGGEDEVQANAMANFVAQTLLRLQKEAAAKVEQLGADADTVVDQDPLMVKIKSNPDAASALEQVSRQLQQEYQESGKLRGKVVPVMVRVQDDELEATSSALKVWKQQLELVEGVYLYMMALQGLDSL